MVKEKRSGQKKPGFFSNLSLRRPTTFSSNVHKYQGEENDFFEIEDMAHGDESGAVQPFKGNLKEPLSHNPINRAAPDETYEIDFVYGYKSEETRQNVQYNASRKPVYMTASLGIILDPKKREQLIFGGGEAGQCRKQQQKGVTGHTDDITCLSVSPDRKFVVSGQVGVTPYVLIWDALTAEKLG